MTRVSPPELARELPGPQASTRVTFAPFRNRWRAVQPPNAPAPTTTTLGPRAEREPGRGFGALAGRAFSAAERACAIDAAGSIARSARRETLCIPVKPLGKNYSS